MKSPGSTLISTKKKNGGKKECLLIWMIKKKRADLLLTGSWPTIRKRKYPSGVVDIQPITMIIIKNLPEIRTAKSPRDIQATTMKIFISNLMGVIHIKPNGADRGSA